VIIIKIIGFKSMRLNKNLTIKQLSNEIGIPVSTLARSERNKVLSIKTGIKLAKYFNCKYEKIVEEVEI
jgi:DNA-binding XRE family transcriptional regulator